VIYGLIAAVGWGFADFFGALSGRRVGSLPAVLIGQLLSAVLVTILLFTIGDGLTSLSAVLGLVALNGIVAMAAYASHYHALQLGPVAVVSPIGAGYAVVGVLLAIVILGERPTPLALTGMVVAIVGTILVSTDLPAFRARIHEPAPGLWWGVGSAIGFGVAGFILGWVVQETNDWVAALWASRLSMLVAFVPLVLARRRELTRLRRAARLGVVFAMLAGATDILGVGTYSLGAERVDVSILLASSAVFPLIAVVASFVWLHERLVANQYAGVALVVTGLALLGLGT
jgi:drug/metabolite transporter (DMT)-like permease